MATGEAKLVYQFSDIRAATPIADRQISIDSTTLDSPDISLPNDCAYFVEIIILSNNGTVTESGARRYIKSYNKSGGVLSAGATPHFLDSMGSRISISAFTTSGNSIIITLQDITYASVPTQTCKVFVNIKAYGD